MLHSLDTARQAQYDTWIEIRRDRLKHNLETLAALARPYAQVLAIVKANAYGHGLIEIARTLAPSVAFLGVSSIHEALNLKEHGIETPILLFGRLFPHELPAVLADGISLSVSSYEEAAEISQCSQVLARRTPVHVKVDTGMGRLGLPLERAIYEIPKMASLAGIALEGLYTHFPTAERADGFTEAQVRKFAFLTQQLKQKGITFRWYHAANSAGSIKVRSPLFNLIRPGLLLYGVYPAPGLEASIKVAPVLSLKSRIIFLKRLKPGDSVGYGRDFVAEKALTIGYLPVGYSHGYPFRLSNRSWVLYRGRRFPLAGRVSMDYLAVNFGNTDVRVGEEVILLGEDGGRTIRAEDLAEWAGTIPYEILTRLQNALPRLYR